jgi:hypothetical protein
MHEESFRKADDFWVLKKYTESYYPNKLCLDKSVSKAKVLNTTHTVHLQDEE